LDRHALLSQALGTVSTLVCEAAGVQTETYRRRTNRKERKEEIPNFALFALFAVKYDMLECD
jgi:hypothetical protein